MELIKTIDR